MIEIRNLHKSFGGLEVLKGIDLEIKKGEIVTIVGPSGSGKSTVLRCMNLLEVPTTGQIIFEGTDITDKKVNIDEVRQRIGMVFQNFNLFPNMTVLDNITLAPMRLKKLSKEEANKKAEGLLDRVGLLDKKDSYPSQLSGGQKQRAFIAMSLAQNTEVLLLDEPTTYLDIYHQIEILEVVKSLNEKYNITIVMVLHDLNQAINYSHNIVIMKNGNLIKQGKATEVLNEQTIKDVYNVSGYIHKKDNEEIYFIPKKIC